MRIEPADYERMRAWLAHMTPKVIPAEVLTSETDPVAVLDRLASKSPAKARSGLSMAVGDLVEMTADWPANHTSALDHELSAYGLPTLAEVRARFSKTVQRIVCRGWIKDDNEFFAIRNAADWAGTGDASLWSLLGAYEAKGAD